MNRIALEGGTIECAWHGPGPAEAPTIVFLHEGLGSLAQWRDVPAELARLTGCGAFVYSRFGYGGSEPCGLPRPLSYMHDEAVAVLPDLIAAAGIRRHVLFGHSDGASIALIHAGAGVATEGLAGLVLEAPHVFAEAFGIEAIRRARAAYETGDLRERLAKYHGANVDTAFYGWALAWTDPGFAFWNIECHLRGIRVPALLLQGEDDEYGTADQLRAIEDGSGGPVETCLLPDCGHSPHRDRRDIVLELAPGFIRRTLQTGS